MNGTLTIPAQRRTTVERDMAVERVETPRYTVVELDEALRRLSTERAPAVEPVATPRRPHQGHLKLTRRGRVVVVLLFLALAMAAFVVFSGTSVATRDTGDPVPTRTVVVSEGDTLWAIAAEVAGDEDLRDVVHEIEQLNSLTGPELVEGQELAVPVR